MTPAAAANSAPQPAITDAQIVRALEEELREARAVDANRIDVEVSDAVATLTGTVGSLIAKDRSVRIAQMLKGVVAVVDLLEVDPSGRIDADIARDVQAALRLDPATDAWEIEASVEDGAVTLRGTVESHAERMLAVLVVKSVAGVRRIDNRIHVAAQSPRADSEIAAEIEQRLQWDVRVDDALITVDVREGRVTLSGSVGSARDVATATTLAWVQGVTAVDASGLAVEWWLRDELKPQRPSARAPAMTLR
jgi:osmotically-inducible protein OsmY